MLNRSISIAAAAAAHSRCHEHLAASMVNAAQYDAWSPPSSDELRSVLQDAVQLSSLLRETLQHAQRLSQIPATSRV